MEIISDLHIHSKYSRACSKELTIKNIAKHCEVKGIHLVGTGDFTHPAWFSEIKKELTEAGEGIYKLKDGSSETRFLLTTEVACIYKKGDRCRRVHLCIFSPSIEITGKIIEELEKRGFNLKSDGRPILGIGAKELLQMLLEIDPRILMVPAHVWTPWFAVFGSESGFDTLEECFDELTPEIYAVETGLSSDPPMNWRFKNLDNCLLLSNSDAHSLDKLGREANVFDFPNLDSITYTEIRRIFKEKDKTKFLYTIEFFPEEGKYHFDGHRLCGTSFHPRETAKYRGICSACKKPLTIGVLSRAEELADRKELPKDRIPFRSLIPLAEIIGSAFGNGDKSKKVRAEYDKLLKKFGSEFNVLLRAPIADLEKNSAPRVAEAIQRMRAGTLEIKPGFDGEYGKIKLFLDDDSAPERKQATIF